MVNILPAKHQHCHCDLNHSDNVIYIVTFGKENLEKPFKISESLKSYAKCFYSESS